MKKIIFSILLFFLLYLTISDARFWTNKEGKSFEGELVEIKDNAITIRRTSDRIKFTVNAADLSQTDQDYLTKIKEDNKNAEEKKRTEEKNKSEGKDVTIVLKPTDAVYTNGKKIRMARDPQRIAWWAEKNDIIQFKIDELGSGRYKINLKYSAAYGKQEGKFQFSFNEKKITKTIVSTGGWHIPKDLSIGSFKHEGGPINIFMEIIDLPDGAGGVFDFHSLEIEK